MTPQMGVYTKVDADADIAVHAADKDAHHAESLVIPFTRGGDSRDDGMLVDAAAEYAIAWFYIPEWVTSVTKLKIYAYSEVTEIHGMLLSVQVYAGADNEPSNTHSATASAVVSTTLNFAAADIIHWELATATVLALKGGDSGVVKLLGVVAAGDNIGTAARFRTIEFEYT